MFIRLPTDDSTYYAESIKNATCCRRSCSHRCTARTQRGQAPLRARVQPRGCCGTAARGPWRPPAVACTKGRLKMNR